MFGQQSQNNQICQFYLRGQCKYGNKCWNIHQGESIHVFGGSSSSASVFSGYGNNNSALQDKQFIEFVKQVGVEMNSWEKNGMWLLSSLAPLKDHPLLAGFSDTSPEELRVEAFEALKKNDLTSYHAKAKEKFEFHKNLRQSLRDQTAEAIEALKAVFYKNGATATSSNKASPAINSLFGKVSSGQPSLFGGATANPSSTAFGSSTSSQPSSIFGNSVNSGGTSQSSSLFGSSVNSTGPNQSSSLFGGSINPSEANQSSNIFGSSGNSLIANKPSNIFGGSRNITGPNQPTNLFGGSGNLAGSNQSSNLFGNSVASSSLFGAKSQNSSFGAAPVFGSLNSNSTFNGTNAFQASGSIFGGQSSNIFGTNSTTTPQGTMFNNNSPNIGASTSLFGNSPLQTPPTFGESSQSDLKQNIFGSQTQGSSASMFGDAASASSNSNVLENASKTQGAQNIFGVVGQTQHSVIFGGSLTNNSSSSVSGASQASLFSGATNSQTFGNDNSQTTIQNSTSFGGSTQVNQDSLFGNKPSQNLPSLFGNNSTTHQVTQQNTSPFALNVGIPGSQIAGQFGTSNTTSQICYSEGASKIYTPLQLLSNEDREEFARDTFLKIPLVPPPKELCV